MCARDRRSPVAVSVSVAAEVEEEAPSAAAAAIHWSAPDPTNRATRSSTLPLPRVTVVRAAAGPAATASATTDGAGGCSSAAVAAVAASITRLNPAPLAALLIKNPRAVRQSPRARGADAAALAEPDVHADAGGDDTTAPNDGEP